MELVYLIIVLTIVPNIRTTLNTKDNFPDWDKVLLYVRWLAVILYIATFLDWVYQPFTIWIWHGFMILSVYIVFSREVFQYVRSLMISILPLIAIGIIETLVQLAFKDFYDTYDNYFGTFKFFGVAWIVAVWFQNKKQSKLLAEERVKREEEEVIRREDQARKAELEQLVAERTWEITQQKEELEEALAHLKATQAQLVQSEKMASLGELTAGIAHEIQNPLNFVNNFAEVNTELIDELKEVEGKQDADRQVVEEILRDLSDNMQKMLYHGKRADSIVKGMLMHSRKTDGEKEKIDVNALADEYLRLAYHGLRAKDKTFSASFEKNLQNPVEMAVVIPQDFGRVLLNIFNNAFYAVMERSKLEDDTYKPTVWLSTATTQGGLEIRIKDNGTGIPEPVRARIFEPFFTTKPTGQGTGLGLSLSYEIVTKGHGGTLAVESQQGEFTEFIINLPQRS